MRESRRDYSMLREQDKGQCKAGRSGPQARQRLDAFPPELTNDKVQAPPL